MTEQKHRKFSGRTVTALVIGMMLLTALLSWSVWSNPDISFATVIEEGSMVSEYNYIFYRDGSTYYAKNGETGDNDYSGTNASYVVHSGLGALTSGRTWKEKVLVKGNFSFTTSFIIPSYTIVKTEGRITLEDDTDTSLFINSNGADGDSHIEIIGGIFDGNSAGQTGGHGVEFYNVTEVVIEYTQFTDFNSYGIYINGTDTSKNVGARISNNNIDSCGSDGIYVYRSEYNLLIIEDNLVYDCGGRGIQVSTSYRYIIQGNTCGLQNHQNTLDGISINGAGAGPEAIIADNTCNFNGRHGIYAIHTLGLAITGNTIMGNDYHGIFIEGIYSRLCLITGNYIADNSVETANTYDNIHIDTDNNTITGNTLRNIGPVYSTRCGVYVTGDNNVVSSNTITGMDSDGVMVINANATVVVGNRILGNAGYGVNEDGTSDFTLLDGNILSPNTTGAHSVDAAGSVVGDNIL